MLIMLMSTWQKINLSRIVVISLAYVAYALYLVLSNTGIYIVNVLLLISSILNGGLSLFVFFIDDEDEQKSARRIFKKFKKGTKFFIQALKLVILAGAFIIYADEQSKTSFALAFVMLSLTVISIVFDLIKIYLRKTAAVAVNAVEKGIEHLKDALRISADWNQVTLPDGKKYRFKAKEQVEWWTRYVLRKKGVEDGSLVKYDGKLVFFSSPDDVSYVTDTRGEEEAFEHIRQDLKDYKYLKSTDDTSAE